MFLFSVLALSSNAQSLLITLEKQQLEDLQSGILLAVVPDGFGMESNTNALGQSPEEAFKNAFKYEYDFSKVAFCTWEQLSLIQNGDRDVPLNDMDGKPVNLKNYTSDKLFTAIAWRGAVASYDDYQFYKKGDLKRTHDLPNVQISMDSYDLQLDRYQAYINQLLKDNSYPMVDLNSYDRSNVEITDDELIYLYRALKNPMNRGADVYTDIPQVDFINDFMKMDQLFNTLVIQRLSPLVKERGKKSMVVNNRTYVTMNFELPAKDRYNAAVKILGELLENRLLRLQG